MTSRVVQKFVAITEGRLPMCVLPPYSPELNRTELVWNNLENHEVARRIITGLDQLKRIGSSPVRALQRTQVRMSADRCTLW